MELSSSLGYYFGDTAAIIQLVFGGSGRSNALYSSGEKRERLSFHITTKTTCHVDCGGFKGTGVKSREGRVPTKLTPINGRLADSYLRLHLSGLMV